MGARRFVYKFASKQLLLGALLETGLVLFLYAKEWSIYFVAKN